MILNADEDAVRSDLVFHLSGYFDLRHEVWDMTNKYRIDILATHKETCIMFGIELKCKKTVYRGVKIAEWVRQVALYERTLWEGHRILIFAYPQISGRIFEEGYIFERKHKIHKRGIESTHNNVSTFIGNFGVGEIQSFNFNESRDVFVHPFGREGQYGGYTKKEYTGKKLTGHQLVHSGRLIWCSQYQDFKQEMYYKVMEERDKYMPKWLKEKDVSRI